MACLNMFNNDQQGLHATMGPRISFSNDFADNQQHLIPIKQDRTYKEAPVSSDFEFSVSGNNMISADELFSKGKMLPVFTKTTLRDELLVEDDHMDVSPQLSRGKSRWRDRLGLKKSHILPRKGDKNAEVLERIDETASALSFHDGINHLC